MCITDTKSGLEIFSSEIAACVYCIDVQTCGEGRLDSKMIPILLFLKIS